MSDHLWNHDKEISLGNPRKRWEKRLLAMNTIECQNQRCGVKDKIWKEHKFSTYEKEKKKHCKANTEICIHFPYMAVSSAMCMAPVGRSLGRGTPPGSRWCCEEGACVRTLWGSLVLPLIGTCFPGLNIVTNEKLSWGDFQHLLPCFIQRYQQQQKTWIHLKKKLQLRNDPGINGQLYFSLQVL